MVWVELGGAWTADEVARRFFFATAAASGQCCRLSGAVRARRFRRATPVTGMHIPLAVAIATTPA